MVEDTENPYRFSIRFLRLLASMLAGAIIAQACACLCIHYLVQDSQAAGMMSDLLIQHLAYYFLACAFLILSISNLLVRRGIYSLSIIRLPSLILVLFISLASFLLIPRMDYLRETALQDGLPVILSPFASYFAILNAILIMLLCAQILTSTLIAWRLSDMQSANASA